MRFYTAIFAFLASVMFASAMPVDKSRKWRFDYVSIPSCWLYDPDVREVADSDDKVAYTWALPESRKREDSDDKVAYTWALPE